MHSDGVEDGDPRTELIDALGRWTDDGRLRWYERGAGIGWVAEHGGYRYTLSPDAPEGYGRHRLEVRLLSCAARREIVGGRWKGALDSLAGSVLRTVESADALVLGALETLS